MKKNKKNYHAGRNSDARLDDKLIIFFHAPKIGGHFLSSNFSWRGAGTFLDLSFEGMSKSFRDLPRISGRESTIAMRGEGRS